MSRTSLLLTHLNSTLNTWPIELLNVIVSYVRPNTAFLADRHSLSRLVCVELDGTSCGAIRDLTVTASRQGRHPSRARAITVWNDTLFVLATQGLFWARFAKQQKIQTAAAVMMSAPAAALPSDSKSNMAPSTLMPAAADTELFCWDGPHLGRDVLKQRSLASAVIGHDWYVLVPASSTGTPDAITKSILLVALYRICLVTYKWTCLASTTMAISHNEASVAMNAVGSDIYVFGVQGSAKEEKEGIVADSNNGNVVIDAGFGTPRIDTGLGIGTTTDAASILSCYCYSISSNVWESLSPLRIPNLVTNVFAFGDDDSFASSSSSSSSSSIHIDLFGPTTRDDVKWCACYRFDGLAHVYTLIRRVDCGSLPLARLPGFYLTSSMDGLRQASSVQMQCLPRSPLFTRLPGLSRNPVVFSL